MKLIITGGAGFIGSNLISHLLSDSQYKVLNLDSLSYSGCLQTIKKFEKEENYNFVKLDLCEKEKLNSIINKYAPDAIMHLAAESHVDRSIDSPKKFIDSNIVGTFNLLEVFKSYFYSYQKTKQTQLKFLHISTDEVYGSLSTNEAAFTEHHNYSPNSPYAASKAASDHLVRAWGKTYNLPVIITNCSNNFGPFQFPEKLIPLIINRALEGKPLPVYGDGSNIRDWLYVEDHVQALCKILHKGRIGEKYNIGGDNEISNLDIVHAICNILDEIKPMESPYHKLIKFVQDRPGHDHRYAINCTKLKTELDWIPINSFKENLRNTVNWYIDNKDWYEHIYNEVYQGQRLGINKP